VGGMSVSAIFTLLLLPCLLRMGYAASITHETNQIDSPPQGIATPGV
jgi:hypothetical protein